MLRHTQSEVRVITLYLDKGIMVYGLIAVLKTDSESELFFCCFIIESSNVHYIMVIYTELVTVSRTDTF